jgi:hypothetical protein
VTALRMALVERDLQPGLVHHSDRGTLLSSAQVGPGWATSTSPCNNFAANDD